MTDRRPARAELTVWKDTDADRKLLEHARTGEPCELTAEYNNDPMDRCTMFHMRIVGRSVRGRRVVYYFEGPP